MLNLLSSAKLVTLPSGKVIQVRHHRRFAVTLAANLLRMVEYELTKPRY